MDTIYNDLDVSRIHAFLCELPYPSWWFFYILIILQDLDQTLISLQNPSSPFNLSDYSVTILHLIPLTFWILANKIKTSSMKN